jgi:hypothetical protein
VDVFDVLTIGRTVLPRLTAVIVVGAMALAPQTAGRLFERAVASRAAAITAQLQDALSPAIQRPDSRSSSKRAGRGG